MKSKLLRAVSLATSKVDPRPPVVYYLAADWDRPSWGNGIIYNHVRMLRQHGINAMIVHERSPFRLSWLDVDVPITYMDAWDFRPRPKDIFVTYEIAADRNSIRKLNCRRFVFVQASFYLLGKLEGTLDYKSLGYERAITIMPHAQTIVERFFDVDAAIVPPYIAPYFFLSPDAVNPPPRKKRILLYFKERAEDYHIVLKMLRSRLPTLRGNADGAWELVELRDKSHLEAAELMQTSMFFINVNCREAFNTTVPEAMAAGCIPVCYEAYGGRDFLQDGVNAYVFPNNYAYPLIGRIESLVDNYETMQDELAVIRRNAFATANQYTEAQTEAALIAFYQQILS